MELLSSPRFGDLLRRYRLAAGLTQENCRGFARASQALVEYAIERSLRGAVQEERRRDRAGQRQHRDERRDAHHQKPSEYAIPIAPVMRKNSGRA